MADVNGSSGVLPEPERERDRAQLFLVGALVLAVLFVTLALLLNTVIYTGNLATRDAGTDLASTIEYEHAAGDAGVIVLHATNDHDGDATYAELSAQFEGGIRAWGNASAQHAAVRGTIASIDRVAVENGTRIRHDPAGGGEFRSITGDPSWTLAGSTRVRNYTIRAEPTETLDPVADPANVTESFYIELDGAETVTVHLYNEEVTDRGCVVIRDDVGDLSTPTCVDDSTVVFDVTVGTIAPADQPNDTTAVNGTVFPAVGPDHSIAYRHGDRINGTYSLSVSSTIGEIETANVNDGDEADGYPYAENTLYDAEYDLGYRSQNVRYETTVRIAPGEAPYDAA